MHFVQTVPMLDSEAQDNATFFASRKQPFPPMPRPLLLSLPDSATISDSESQEEVR